MSMNIVIAGGGVAGLEALLALHAVAGDRVSLRLIAPDSDFSYRPMAVAEPFALGSAHRVPLREFTDETGADLVLGAVDAVDDAAGELRLDDGGTRAFDALLVAPGGRAVSGVDGATTWWPGGVDGGDDLVGVDALQVDRGRAEIGVAELALDHVERHALARERDGMRVAQLVRREAATDTRLSGKPAELDPHVGARPRPPARRAVDHVEQRPDRELGAGREPGSHLFPAPGVHADLPAATALAVANEQRAAPGVEVAFAERQRLRDSQAAAPEPTISARSL
jgi:hypothetical protein